MADYVQVPVSLIERVESLLRTSDDRYGRETGRALAAYLSQPSPTAEPTSPEPAWVHENWCASTFAGARADQCTCHPYAGPPRIEDMAPGTESHS